MTAAKHHKGGQPGGAQEAAPVPHDAAPAPAPDISHLQLQLEEKTKEAQENYERYLRLAAETENLKKRLEREKADLLQFANENLLKELLPVVDHVELALEHGRQAGTPAPFLEGLELVHQGFLKALRRFGVTPLAAVGQPFDPAYHNAVMQEAAPEVPTAPCLRSCRKVTCSMAACCGRPWSVVARNTQENSNQTDSTDQEDS